MRLAFVYDRLNKLGGAERILKCLHELWPDSPFYTAVHHPRRAPFTAGWRIRPSFLQHIPFAASRHELFPWLTPFAFESFALGQFDVVISLTSADAKAVICPPSTLHICYLLTPTRYLWSHTHAYLHQGIGPLRPLTSLVFSRLRRWDQVAAQRPDVYLTISHSVRRRLGKYYRRQAEVIYPPVDTDFFCPPAASVSQADFPHGFFLIVSRLVAYKRIDLAIAACNRLQLPLVIVGIGDQAARLRRLAGPTVVFLGQVTDQKLLSCYQACRALIFPGEEDFGLTMLEAHSVGKPVIAYRHGGAREIVVPYRTGLLYWPASAAALTAALRDFLKLSFAPRTIRSRALRFSAAKFKRRFSAKITSLWSQYH